ncbi:MAG: polysaccharide export protein [Pseudomonadota bacterium]
MRRLVAILFGLCAAACATAFETPRNSVDLSEDGYTLARAPMQSARERRITELHRYTEEGRCVDADLPLARPQAPALRIQTPVGPPLSPGDMVRLVFTPDEAFDGAYIITPDGTLDLPGLRPFPAAGFAPAEVATFVAGLMVDEGIYRASYARPAVNIIQWAPVQIHVSGAVFQPGDVLINSTNAESVQGARVEAFGDVAEGRTLSRAISAAAGVRPDADIRHVVVIRAGRRSIYDLSGAFTGAHVEDPILIAGDQVHIPSRSCFQAQLARPSRITTPGVRVFMSNLTQPASSNAQSAIGRDATNLPYGTRLLQGLVSANCVGGVQATNANRWAVLISRNPVTGESEVIARSIEDLVRRADRDRFNPVLLPNDAIACYDSHATNLRDVVRAFGEVLSPGVSLAITREALR